MFIDLSALLTEKLLSPTFNLIGILAKPGRYSLPRDAPPAHVARAALFAPHGGRDGPDHGELGGGAGLLAAR